MKTLACTLSLVFVALAGCSKDQSADNSSKKSAVEKSAAAPKSGSLSTKEGFEEKLQSMGVKVFEKCQFEKMGKSSTSYSMFFVLKTDNHKADYEAFQKMYKDFYANELQPKGWKDLSQFAGLGGQTYMKGSENFSVSMITPALAKLGKGTPLTCAISIER
ncbi:MAG: hypothetical protein A2X36_03255 [Elusimicrobia bacterium GWA2_69_24]|nr:MAG: hypothetical protein A2X36_03255 [Elusimicrobia bacterium GWA2_69_24]